MPAPPNPVKLYHITAIANLAGIAARGGLRSKSWLAKQGIGYSDIAYQSVQGRRALKPVPLPPGGMIHDYVPFYFAPRSPMLFTINNGNVPGCAQKQAEILHILIKLNAVVDARLPFVFFDYNATLDYAACYNDLRDLNRIDWPLFFEEPRVEWLIPLSQVRPYLVSARSPKPDFSRGSARRRSHRGAFRPLSFSDVAHA